ncbi:MAG: hypothetical protein GY862_17525, partial [Gammaproteobacteria bacterium]|nr:hypothetical protein [Gammaproteobacteria bacterium]
MHKRSDKRKLSIKQKLFFGFGLMAGLGILVAGLAGSALWIMKLNFTSIIEEGEPMSRQTMMLSEQIKQAEASLGFFLLSKENLHKQAYVEELGQLNNTLEELKKLKSAREDAKVKGWINTIETNLRVFQSYRDSMLELAGNDLKNFPGRGYAVENIDLVLRSILESIANMLDDEQNDMNRMDVFINLYELRYAWANISAEMRAYMAFRGNDSLKNAALYIESAAALEDKFKTNYGDDLTFIQEEELTQLTGLRPQFLLHLKEMVRLHGGEQWRLDAYVVRTEITPL